MSELPFLCTQLLLYKGIVHANISMILIKEIDDNGDAAIKFEAWKRERWVFEGDLNKLKKIQAVRP